MRFTRTSVMSLTNAEISIEIEDNEKALSFFKLQRTLSLDARCSDDLKQIEWLTQERQLLLNEQARRTHRSTSVSSSAPKSSAAKKPAMRGDDCGEDFPGPPIIVKDSDGTHRTWRPGDRIQSKRGG